jgi:antitoxin MazE
MKLARCGNSIAFRVPAELFKRMNVKPDEEFQMEQAGDDSIEVVRDRSRKEAIEAMRRLDMPLPAGFKFNRDEIYDRFERSLMGRQEANRVSKQELDAE